jgi:RHS repeat-associated protein
LSYNAADNEGDQQVTKRVSWSASELAGGEWVRKYVIFRVPSTPNGAPYWEVYAYLYGHYGEGVIEFDDYRIEEFVTQPSGPPPETPGYEYTGKKRDSATGLYYFGARYYDPEVGRFITEDPKNSSFKIYSPQTYNRYVYCLNNPLGYIDPDGKETVVVIFREKMLGFLWVATHTAMRVDNPLGEPVMYDPAGKSYHPVDQYGGPIRGSGDQFEGKYADLQALLDIYEAEGYKCDVYSFKTTPEEEKTIADRIEEKGGVSPLLCATAISDVLRGVGPFEKLKGSIFPGRLGKGLSKIKQSTIEIKEEHSCIEIK